jgi:hypothetical protein
MNNDFKVKLCQDDFYLMMRNAVLQAGGRDDVAKWKGMKLDELVNIFAQNGIRMVHMPEKHMDCVDIIWKTKTPDVKYSISSPTTPKVEGEGIARKQLAEDIYDSKYDKLPEFN